MNIQLKGGALKSRAMVLYINRNTRTAKGYFLISETTEDKKGYVHNKDKNTLSRWNIIKLFQRSPIRDDKLKKRLKTLSSLYNMGILKIIKMGIFHTILTYQVIPQTIN